MKLETTYQSLLSEIGQTLVSAKENAYTAINTELLHSYWSIGRYIAEYELKGKGKSEYGGYLYRKLADDLTLRYGKGFSRSGLHQMKQFYDTYPIVQTLSGRLTWSHYTVLLGVSDDLARLFYEKQAEKEHWSFRELKRQVQSGLFNRLALSKDKDGLLLLSQQGQVTDTPESIVKDPYILEFLGIPEDEQVTERNLEDKLIKYLEQFLLELGKGFSFVGRQQRITIGDRHFHVDLVFYHIILRCYVLIDLKVGEVQHEDIGQMNLYINYFKEERMNEGDTEPIGIILCADKRELVVKYALGGVTNQLFVSKYQLYLPNKEELQRKIKAILDAE
jgi:predicted nuclease of restriction endonuclease-like (RecB) superfamily